MAANPPSFFGEALAAIDTAGKVLKAKLDELWVPYDPQAGTGGLYWHGAASLQTIEALKGLLATEEAIKAIDWPTPAEEDATETPTIQAEEPASDDTPTPEPATEAPVPETTPEEVPPPVAPDEPEPEGVSEEVAAPPAEAPATDATAAAAPEEAPESAPAALESEPTPDNPSA